MCGAAPDAAPGDASRRPTQRCPRPRPRRAALLREWETVNHQQRQFAEEAGHRDALPLAVPLDLARIRFGADDLKALEIRHALVRHGNLRVINARKASAVNALTFLAATARADAIHTGPATGPYIRAAEV